MWEFSGVQVVCGVEASCGRLFVSFYFFFFFFSSRRRHTRLTCDWSSDVCSSDLALHQDGVPSGFKPILVMDVWEHAFLLDYKPAERGKYINAFFSNVNWEAVEIGRASCRERV